MSEEKKKVGFAAMSPERLKEVASAGGKASHVKGTGHQWTSESASIAGRKGGLASTSKRKLSATPKGP